MVYAKPRQKAKAERGMNLKDRICNILNVLDKVSGRTITVFGDYALDKYLYINPARNEPSLETGLTAYQVERRNLLPGVGGTVTNNLRALGVSVHCVGLVGKDGEGFELLRELGKIGAYTDLMVCCEKIMTNTYIKPMIGSENKTYTEMSRLDIRNFSETPAGLEDRLLENLEKALASSQGVVVTDQFLSGNCSALTERVRRELAGMARRFQDKIFYVDSRGFAASYRDVIIKCNRFELPPIDGDDTIQEKDAIFAGGRNLLSAGADGAYVFEGDKVTRIPAYRVRGPVDVVGAGDATNAGVIIGLSLGLDLPDAVLLGACISSITIQQIGVTGTATIAQIKERILQYDAD